MNGEQNEKDEKSEDDSGQGVAEPEPMIPAGEDEDLGDESELAPYLREAEPEGKMDKAKYWLLRDRPEDEIAAMGIAPGSIRIARDALVDEGLLKKKPRKQLTAGKEAPARTSESKTMQVFAKGSPPEALINALELPDTDGQIQGFEQGMKFGMSILVTAVRVVNEMSIIGSQQVKPLLDMSKSMREGEAMTYKAGAEEAAYKAAQAMGNTIIPQISAIEQAIAGIEKGAGTNPMQAMMVRTMEPLIGNLMNRLMPGTPRPLPGDWTKRQE